MGTWIGVQCPVEGCGYHAQVQTNAISEEELVDQRVYHLRDIGNEHDPDKENFGHPIDIKDMATEIEAEL